MTAQRVTLRLGLRMALISAICSAPATAQISPTRTTLRLAATIPAPQGLSAWYDAAGVKLGWQQVTEAAQYLVMRAPDAATPAVQIAALPAGSSGHQDRGFYAAASYHVVAVAADGRRGISPVVAYVPPATLAIDKTQLSGTRTTLATTTTPTYQPPGTYVPPVGLTIKPWNPSLHQISWNWDGANGYAYYQVYKMDPVSPSGRLVRDRLQYREFWDSSFIAPNTTSYRIVGFSPDGRWGSADVAYPNPPQPVAPAPFSGIQWSAGAVKLSWQTLPGALRYRLFGPTLPADGLPVGGLGVSNIPATHIVTGLALGTHTFSIGAEYSAGMVPNLRASTGVTVHPTSGNYRVLLKVLLANQESADDPLSMDGRGDEIYAAAYWATYPFYAGAATQVGVVQTRVYGDANQAPDRIKAGTGSATGGIRTGNVIPDGMAPVLQPGVATYTDRLPLLVWQGALADSGQILVVNPTVWESDRNNVGNFPDWFSWWNTPNGRGAMKDKVYAPNSTGSIAPVWLGYFSEDNWPIQPPMNVGQGMDRPVGIGGLDLGFGNHTKNLNSLSPMGIVLTRDRIDRALGGNSAVMIPVRQKDRSQLSGDYTIFVQIERIP